MWFELVLERRKFFKSLKAVAYTYNFLIVTMIATNASKAAVTFSFKSPPSPILPPKRENKFERT